MSLFYHTPALQPPEVLCILGKTLPELYSYMQTMIISTNNLTSLVFAYSLHELTGECESLTALSFNDLCVI